MTMLEPAALGSDGPPSGRERLRPTGRRTTRCSERRRRMHRSSFALDLAFAGGLVPAVGPSLIFVRWATAFENVCSRKHRQSMPQGKQVLHLNAVTESDAEPGMPGSDWRRMLTVLDGRLSRIHDNLRV